MGRYLQKVISELEALSIPEKRKILSRFFKTGKGEYGEGDKFMGIIVPDVRKVAKEYKDMPLESIEELLESKWHECRMCALQILVIRFAEASPQERNKIYEFYLAHTDRINNWDLTDLSAPQIIGMFLMDKPRTTAKKADVFLPAADNNKRGETFPTGTRTDLYILAASKLLWDQRIAVVSTYPFIKRGDCEDIIRLSELFLHHKHPLIQKATGWMLREAGKRNEKILTGFLDLHGHEMPRTMLRYSIEKLSPELKRYYMAK